nr:MAG TPA: hypothetical protein [Caudoviricetes sp.]
MCGSIMYKYLVVYKWGIIPSSSSMPVVAYKCPVM